MGLGKHKGWATLGEWPISFRDIKMKDNLNLSERIVKHLDGALQRQALQQQRNYLGASALGAPCDRALQYGYWQTPVDADKARSGQTYRRFAAGHAFEQLAAGWLNDAGFTLQTHNENEEQYGFTALDGRFQGHIDGIITAVPQDIELACPTLWEHKALNNKSWQALVKQGVSLAHPVYAAQIALYQAYMAETIPCEHPALLMAINKETAELYFERIPFDAALAQRISDRAVNVLQACQANDLLPRITREPAYYLCRCCQWQTRCWAERKNEQIHSKWRRH